MAAPRDCPEIESLQALADDTAPAGMWERYEQHVESCRACQERLDQIGAGGDALQRIGRRIGDPTAVPDDPTLSEALRRLREVRSPITPAVPEGDLSFLGPRSGGSLGTLGQYEVQEVIGRGGMGIVLKGFEAALRRPVAIKFMAPELAGSATARQRFTREVKAAAAVTHEHIVKVHRVDEVNGLPYMVMQFIAGESLQTRLNRGGPLPLAEVVRIGLETASALAAAHAHGLIHRDIKPANLLLEGETGRVKVTDFGLARMTDDVTLTQNGVVAGTPEYMAPEQARGDKIDCRADLFSLGSVLYALCTGDAPFRKSTTLAVLRQVSETVPAPLRSINPNVPAWFESFVARLMAKDPEERFQTAAEVAELLKRYLAHLRQPRTHAAPKLPPLRNRERSRRKRAAGSFLANRRAHWLLGSAAAILVVLLGGWYARIAFRGGMRDLALAPGGNRVEQVAGEKQPPTEPETFLFPPVPLAAPIDEQVLALAFSRDGTRLVTAGARHTQPGQLIIWDVASAKALTTLRGMRGIRSVAISPDGKTVACGHFGGAIQLRDATTGQEPAVLNGHTIGVNSVAFSRDGTRLVSAGLDKLVKIWDMNTLQEVKLLAGHTDMVFSAAFFGNGQAVVTGGSDQTVRIWNVATGREKLTLRGHASAVEMVAVSPDDKIVATASWDDTIRLWDADTGTESGRLKANHGSVLAIAFSPDQKYLASGGADGTVRLWDVKKRTLVRDLQKHGSNVWTLAFSRDGKYLASGSSDRTAKLWDMATGKERVTLDTRELGTVRALAYAPDGKDFALAGDDNLVRIRDSGGLPLINLAGHAETVNCLAISPDGQTVASGSSDKTIKLWQRKTFQEKLTLKGHTERVNALAFAPDGKKLASAGQDKSIRIWDVATGKSLATLPGHTARVLCAAFAPDGMSLASGSADETIMIWYLDMKTPPAIIKARQGAVRALAFAPGGSLASAGDDGTVKIWEPAPGRLWRPGEGNERVTLKGHNGAVCALVFSPSGQSLVSGGSDGSLRVWDAGSGAARAILQGHRETVTALAMHPQGDHIISGSSDGTLLRWYSSKSPSAAALQEAASAFPAGTAPGTARANQAAKIMPGMRVIHAAPKTQYRQEYAHVFKENEKDRQDFQFEGPEAEECVHFEPAGLHITLPADWPDKRVGTGVSTTFAIKGDFEITVGFKILEEPKPAAAGRGTGLYVGFDLETPETTRATLTRGVSEAGKQHATWLELPQPGADTPLSELRSFGAFAQTGRLRMVRSGNIVSYWVAEGASEDFVFLQEKPFSAADAKGVRIGGQTGGRSAALDGVFTDLRVRADSLPGLPDTVAANMNENGSKGWLAATLLIACALVFGVTLVAGLYRRLSRPGTQIAGNAGVLSKQAPSQSTPATVAFVCSGCAKSLVAKVALAGKTIKCPACGNATTVPAAEASLARQTPVAAAPRRPLWKRWQLWGALVLGVVFLACGMLVAFHHPRRIPMVDISLGNEFVAEVEESGFLAQDHDKQGQPFRWTTGHAKLVIPIDRAHPPQGLYVHLWPYRPANAEAGWLQLLVNQREMCGKEITRDQWQRTFDLGGMALGDEVVVEILSDTFVPSNLKNAGPDNRTLGLTVRDVKLLSRLDGPKN